MVDAAAASRKRSFLQSLLRSSSNLLWRIFHISFVSGSVISPLNRPKSSRSARIYFRDFFLEYSPFLPIDEERLRQWVCFWYVYRDQSYLFSCAYIIPICPLLKIDAADFCLKFSSHNKKISSCWTFWIRLFLNVLFSLLLPILLQIFRRAFPKFSFLRREQLTRKNHQIVYPRREGHLFFPVRFGAFILRIKRKLGPILESSRSRFWIRISPGFGKCI